MPNIEDHIRKAMEEGYFDNLAGKGKRLKLDDNPHEDPEWSMAFRALKNAGYSLPWIETRQEILKDLDELRQTLARAWAWRNRAVEQNKPLPNIEAEWKRAQDAFREKIAQLNHRIRNLNLETPIERFQLARINAENEIKAVTHQG